MDKLKNIMNRNKKIIFFLIILLVVALISGSLFCIILNDVDKQLVIESIAKFLENIKKPDYITTLKQGLINNSIYITVIWLLGFSIIGIPIILFSFFLKVFVLGFSIANFISIYGLKGIVYSLAYIFPHHILNIINYIFLSIVTLKVSFSLMYAIFKKKKIDFKPIMNHYFIYLAIGLGMMLVSTLLEVYLMPLLMRLLVGN